MLDFRIALFRIRMLKDCVQQKHEKTSKNSWKRTSCLALNGFVFKIDIAAALFDESFRNWMQLASESFRP